MRAALTLHLFCLSQLWVSAGQPQVAVHESIVRHITLHTVPEQAPGFPAVVVHSPPKPEGSQPPLVALQALQSPGQLVAGLQASCARHQRRRGLVVPN